MKDNLTDFARTLNLTFGPGQREPRWPSCRGYRRLPRAFVMTDTQRLSEPLSLINLLPRDIAIIFRHYNYRHRQSLASKLVTLAHRRGVKVLIAGDLHLARKIHADGVHLPSYLLRTWQGRQLKNVPPHWLITAAIHTRQELRWATKLSADAMLVSPIYKTNTQIQRQALGLTGLRRFALDSPIPVFALGGIKLSLLPRLKNTGAAGFAGIKEFLTLI